MAKVVTFGELMLRLAPNGILQIFSERPNAGNLWRR